MAEAKDLIPARGCLISHKSANQLFCHSRESGNPSWFPIEIISASAGIATYETATKKEVF